MELIMYVEVKDVARIAQKMGSGKLNYSAVKFLYL